MKAPGHFVSVDLGTGAVAAPPAGGVCGSCGKALSAPRCSLCGEPLYSDELVACEHEVPYRIPRHAHPRCAQLCHDWARAGKKTL